MSDAKVCHMCLMGGFQCQLCGRTLKAKHLARIERRAKDWAKGAQGGDSYHGEPCTYCDSCNRSVDGRYGKCDAARPHAHDCDAAIILDLERESVG